MTTSALLPYVPRPAAFCLDPAIWPLAARLDDTGRLCVGGVALTDIADRYGTPTYVIDETDFRTRIHRYRHALPDTEIVYAGKALLTIAVARWVAQEHIGLDVCSSGELAIALAGGVDPMRIIMHGNAKSHGELQAATAAGVGRIVIDSLTEIGSLTCIAPRTQQVLVRVTPDVDIHGHAAVTTGVTDQKFGFAITGGSIDEAVTRISHQPTMSLVGLHCHIGSQVTDPEHYSEAIDRMIALMADIRTDHDLVLTELNIGGGHGVPYVHGDPELDLTALRAHINDGLDRACAARRFPRPRVVIEPGRAIAARSGVTLYRVFAVKSQLGARTFVVVDGGMSDNPRVELYGAKYTATLANRQAKHPTQPMTIAGRHCESGDEIARDIELPSDIRPGDLLAIAVTGAYHHSMASNYNVVYRPPLVAVHDGDAHAIVRRETTTDLLARDLG